MLRRFQDIKGAKVQANDGDVGTVNDFFFDDETWTVRYLALDTGIWLGRVVVIPVAAVGAPDWNGNTLPINLLREEIENAPDVFDVQKLTRQLEADVHAYYGYPHYWGGPELWAWAGRPAALASPPPPEYIPSPGVLDPLITSVFGSSEVSGYHIHAQDGEIGHIDDFVIDDETWSIRYLQLDTSNWIGGKTVLLGAPWVGRIDVETGLVHAGLKRDQIEQAPEFDPKRPIDREFEQRLHYHYGQAGYWEHVRARAAGFTA